MAKRKPDEPKKGAPEWQCTFSDLMNLLLCFFVLLFSMSSVEESKWEEVVASMTSAFSIFSDGSTSIGDGNMVGLGTSQLSNLDEYYSSLGETAEDKGEDVRETADGTKGQDSDKNISDVGEMGQKTIGEVGDVGETGEKTIGENGEVGEAGKTVSPSVMQEIFNSGTITEEQLKAMLNDAGEEETKEMLDTISEIIDSYQMTDLLDLGMDVDGRYVEIILSGSVLIDSGSDELKDECLPLLSKVGDILKIYSDHYVDVIGHTDNVPIKSVRFPDNDALSSARAISAAQYLVNEKGIDVSNISWTGRGEYDPIDTNSTPEGRSRNRRVEIRIYNSYSSR